MRKIFGFLLCALVLTTKVYAEEGIPTEKQYTFDRANVASVLAEFIEDEKKAEKAADKYNELSNNSENAISAVDFVDVCVAGGMNMKLADGSGYMKCLDMFMKLIEMQNLDAGGFDMYCPATGNALKSITDKTQVGDICGGTPDTYIEYGHVTLKTDDKNGQHKYVCTCTPQSCKDGYYWNKEKYQCSVKDKDGYCVRHILGSFEYKNGKLPTDSGVSLNDWNKRNNAYYNDKYAQINASTDAFNRCVEYGANQGCRIRGALASADVGSGFGNAKKYQVICNPENYEIAADKKVQEEKEKKHKAELAENMTYYEVCGKKDKGKGKCVDDVFTNIVVGGTQVDPRGAAFLAEEYARVHFNDEIKCKADEEGIRRVLTDYFIKCRSVKDLSKYYEFKFDDTKESFDDVVRRNVDRAICEKIYGFKLNGTICETSKENCTGKIIPAYERYYGDGRAHAYYGQDIYAVIPDYTYKCRINHAPLFENSKLSNDFGDKLDNYAFCKNTYNQLRNDDNLINLIKEYMSSQLGINKYQIECVPASKKWPGGCSAESQNMMEFATNPSDNLISCHVGDKWVDFVFDDTHELSKKLSEVSMDAMQCVIGGHELSVKLDVELNAKNKGKKCTGLDDKLCKDLDKMIRNRGGSGAHYDTKKRACILNSAEEYASQELAQNVAIGAVVAVGTSLFVIGSGGVGAALIVGGSMFAVDTAVNGGLYIVEKLEDGQAGRRFTRFINAAKKCKDSKCAQLVIEQNYNDLNAVIDELNFEDAAEFQTELERLLDLMDVCRMDDDGTVYMGTKDGDCLLAVRQLNLASENKSLQYASFGLMIGDFIFDPASAFSKVLSRGGKIAKILSKIGNLSDLTGVNGIDFILRRFGKQAHLRSGSKTIGKDYYRIMVNDGDDIDGIVYALQKEGYYVSSNKADGEKFIAVSKENIFGPWDNSTNNWLKYGNNVGNTIDADFVRLKNKASQNFDRYLQEFLNTGTSNGLPVSRLSRAEWEQLNISLRNQGVELFETQMLNEKTGKYEDVMKFRKTNNIVSNNVADVGNNISGKYNKLFHEKLEQYTEIGWEYKSAAESGLKRGHYRVNVSNMTDAEIAVIQNKLKYSGVANEAKILETENKGRFLIIYEDDIADLGSNMVVSGSMLNNTYNSAKNIDNLQVKVENILNTKYPNENALRQAWHNSGAWDMNNAQVLANDLRVGIIEDIRRNPDLANRIKRYNSLNMDEKANLWADINYIVGGQNRTHSGNTVLGFVDDLDFELSGKSSFRGAHNGNGSDHFLRYYRSQMNNFDEMIGVVVHENVHGFQDLGRTAINKNALQYKKYNYNRSGGFGNTSGYNNQLGEMESRFMQEYVSKNFLQQLLRYL